MKFAISTDEGFVSLHFGRCATFTLVEAEGNQVLNVEEIANPEHNPGFLPQFLSDRGVECIICGGMGHRAQSLFQEKGINTMVGVVGRVEEVIDKLTQGHLQTGKSLCDPGSGKTDHDEACHREEKREQQ